MLKRDHKWAQKIWYMENPINDSNQLYACKDTDEERVMHSKSDNIEILINDETETLPQSLLSKYPTGLETSIKGSNFIFDCFCLLCFKCHKSCIKNRFSWLNKKQKSINTPYQQKR